MAEGTLDYLRRMKERRTQAVDSNVDDNIGGADTTEVADLTLKAELTLEMVDTLEKATEFIKTNEKGMMVSWFNMAHGLKKVRDERLYEQTYSSFQEYYEAELGYKKRMVYYFLDIAENYPLDTKEEIVQLGVKKLLALSDLEDTERSEYIENNDLTNKSSKEIKEDVTEIIEHKKELNKGVHQTEKQNTKDGEEPADEKVNYLGSGFGDNGNGYDDSNSNYELSVSISNEELKLIKRVYEKIEILYSNFDKFKSSQQEQQPIDKVLIDDISNNIMDFEKEIEKLKGLFAKYQD